MMLEQCALAVEMQHSMAKLESWIRHSSLNHDIATGMQSVASTL